MNTEIYNLRYDFEQQNGHFMVIQSGENQNLTSDDLTNLQVNMLKSNTIDKVLPVVIEEMDFNVKLYFKITQKRMLSQVLREDSLEINEFFNLLYQIVSGIDASKEYMLSERNFVIQDDFIYIGKDFNDVYLTYLPINQVVDKLDIKDEIKELLIKLVGHVKELSGDGVQQLMNDLNDDNFNLTNFKKRLNNLRKKSVLSGKPVTPVSNVNQQIKTTNYQQQTNIQNTPRPTATPNLKPKVKQKNSNMTTPKKSNVKRINETATEISDDQAGEQKKPNLIVILAIAILALAGIWKLYESIPSQIMLILCIILSLIVVAGAVVFYLVKKSSGNKVENVATPKAKGKKTKNKKTKRQSVQEQIVPKKMEPHVDHQANNVSQQQSAVTVNEEEYFKNLQNQTTLLSADSGTVLLNEEVSVSGTTYLEVQRSNELEIIPINQKSFTIGRNPSGIEYVENSVGISRVHLEIESDNGHYTVKDLGSKNGSKLNGEAMIAYKLYALKDSDIITAGKIEYTFKIG